MERAIGELIEPIVAKAIEMVGFQELLSRCPTAEDRKEFIMQAYICGVLSSDDCAMMLEVYGLETA